MVSVLAGCSELVQMAETKSPEASQTAAAAAQLTLARVPTDTPQPTVTPVWSPVAQFEEVVFMLGVFPAAGGPNWEYTDMHAGSGGGRVNTDILKQEGYTPLAENGVTLSKLAEGASGNSFYILPRLDVIRYVSSDGSLATAQYDAGRSQGLVYVYTDRAGKSSAASPGLLKTMAVGSVDQRFHYLAVRPRPKMSTCCMLTTKARFSVRAPPSSEHAMM